MDDSLIASGSSDGATVVSDTETQQKLHCLEGHGRPVKVIAWDPQHPKTILTGGRDGTTRLWDLRLAKTFDDNPQSLIHTDHAETTISTPSNSSKPSVTGIAHFPEDPYHILTSNSCNG